MQEKPRLKQNSVVKEKTLMSDTTQKNRRGYVISSLFLSALISAPSFSADGHCSYIQRYDRSVKGMKVCWSPVDEHACNKRDGVFSRGACSAESVVGVCTFNQSEYIYYEGNPQNIEIGCTYREGEWQPRRKSSSAESSP